MEKKQHIDTVCVQGGYTPGNGEPRQIPIVQSTTFKYATGDDMGKLFDLEASGYFYSRLQNPTCDTVAAKICAMEGGTAAMLTSSGQAANFFAVFNIANAGDHVVASSAIYGGTFNLFSVTMKKMGIDFTFVSPTATKEELDAAFRPNTKALFGETIANPALNVLDIEMFAGVAHAHGVPLIIDNTFATNGARILLPILPPNTWTVTALVSVARSLTAVSLIGWHMLTVSPDLRRPMTAITVLPTPSALARRVHLSLRQLHS